MATYNSNEGLPHFISTLIAAGVTVDANTARAQGMMPVMGHHEWTVVFTDKAGLVYGDVYDYLAYVTTQAASRTFDEAATDRAMVFKRMTDFYLEVVSLPVFTTPLPPDATFTVGDTILLETVVTGATTLQWFKDGAELSGETAQNFSKANCVAGDAGVYKLDATNSDGTVSTTCTVTVNAAKKVA